MKNWKDKYYLVGHFSEGRAWVTLNNKCGFVDADGNEVIPLKYDDVWNFSEGRAGIQLEINGEIIEGEIDLDGKEYFSRQALAILRKHRLSNILDSIS
jgi:hypothetical protein